MQQSIARTRVVVTRVGAAVLVIGVLLGGALAVAGLGATGNLPWTSGGEQRATASPAARAEQLARAYEAKLARLEADELLRSTLAARAAQQARQAQLQQFYARKEARQEAAELQASMLAARAAQQEKLRRYVERKEQQLDGLP
jgi:hypothetical protein